MALSINRRQFVRDTAVAGVGVWIAGSSRAASAKKLNIAAVGAGGRGKANIQSVAQQRKIPQQIVALCDVDSRSAKETRAMFPDAAFYWDYREMLEKEGDRLDAVLVSTPDHMHAPVAAAAMEQGLGVYVEKPLTHNVHEARVLTEMARKHKVATQMGNNRTGETGFRRSVEALWSGAIGQVRQVHVWTDRPGQFWAQPAARPTKTQEVPKELNWDLWLGVAPYRPYHEIYLPRKWRAWFDFGAGALGDMGCHTINLPFMGLKLGGPSSVQASSSEVYPESFPAWSIIDYEFPARGSLPAVKLRWYDGGKYPPAELFMGEEINKAGALMIGDEGTMYAPGDYGTKHTLLPRNKFENYTYPTAILPRGGHYIEFLEACRGGPPPLSNFDYAGPLSETVLLGNVAVRTGKRIEWDSHNLKAVGAPEADAVIRRTYREGYSL